MRTTVKLPHLGDGVGDVMVMEWLTKVGDQVDEGAALVTVETDKVDAEVPSPVSGLVVEHLVRPGQEVAPGTAICVLESMNEHQESR